MELSKVTSLYRECCSFEVSTTIHAGERMVSETQAIYMAIGRDAFRSIMAGLIVSTHTRDCQKVVDYGCGHGRVARHLRAWFPTAEMW